MYSLSGVRPELLHQCFSMCNTNVWLNEQTNATQPACSPKVCQGTSGRWYSVFVLSL